jgi:formylglycine-generating enzyme required for sulfatase activity
MEHPMNKLKNLLFPAALLIAGVAATSCASTADVLVNKDPGSFYGAAFGASQAEAEQKAYLDLVYNVLTETNSLRPATRKAAFVLSPEIREAFAPFKLRPEKAEKKSAARFDVVYRLPRAQWEKAETARLARLNKELGGSFAALSSAQAKPLSARVKEASALLAAIDRSGAINKLVGLEGAGNLLNDQIESYCRGLAGGIALSASPASGLVKAGAQIGIQAADKGGAALASLPLSIVWKAEGRESEPLSLLADGQGKASATVPADPAFSDRKLSLSVSANFESLEPSLAFLKALDDSVRAEYSYRNSAASAASSQAPRVAAGSYTIGAVRQDKRAGSVEKSRKVSVASFSIEPRLVTNAEYKVYLDATNAGQDEYPDYWDNPDFNKPEQPVIGVSLKEAEKYAAWLSSVRGVKMRLPTEEEFEVAARGGKDSVYPWGDELPSDGERATFSGNSSATTAVGSRENGKSALGLYDMAGDVWEWTTSAPAGTMSGDQNYRIVKGGSYMDGQYELRISNRVLRNPDERYPDVGFRLVSEVGV